MDTKRKISLAGQWEVQLQDGSHFQMKLPGTLDENGIGEKDRNRNPWHPGEMPEEANEALLRQDVILTRFTRKYTYEGEVRISRWINWHPEAGKRVFLKAERARCLRLFIDGQEVPHFRPATISTPHIFEVTGYLTGKNEILFLSDNSYPGLPYDGIIASSAATDETQTNWNGILGELALWEEAPVFIENLRIYPQGDVLRVEAELCSDRSCEGKITLACSGAEGEALQTVQISKGRTKVVFEQIPCLVSAEKWDEYEGNLQWAKAELYLNGEKEPVSEKTELFGLRSFADNGKGRLSLNGRVIFLRGETNCAEFPEEGHPPMEVDRWEKILEQYQAYGVNCVRFHSHCPPEAAFIAADRLGMLMQPELSHWNPKDALESEESYQYYDTELSEMILWLANHPSFVMLTLGNELHASEKGKSRMWELLKKARRLDAGRLYAVGSNAWYGEQGADKVSDFYTAQRYYGHLLRATSAAEGDGKGEKGRLQGYLNRAFPCAANSYEEGMALVRREYAGPVFGFEVGQYEVLPDFDELESFQGISLPENYRVIQERVEERGLWQVWKNYVNASGELALLGYREEVEAVLRTEEMSGLSLLSLQDFPGQGTALVGMLNAHLDRKPYEFAKPERFRRFFRESLPLVLLPKYTYESGEVLEAEIKIANYGKKELTGIPKVELRRHYCSSEQAQCRENKGEKEADAAQALYAHSLEEICCHRGELTALGKIRIPLSEVWNRATGGRRIGGIALELTVSLEEISNTYPLWLYAPVSPVCPEAVYETECFDTCARKVLAEGGSVYLSPKAKKETMPHSIGTQFTTDFWSVGTFPAQEGGMGQLIDAAHPLFALFPTECYTQWQWWHMAGTRALVLPEQKKAIITEMDSYAYLRPMAQLLECRCTGGRLLISSMGLQELQDYPECRALQQAIYTYLASEQFMPEQEMSVEEVEKLFQRD